MWSFKFDFIQVKLKSYTNVVHMLCIWVDFNILNILYKKYFTKLCANILSCMNPVKGIRFSYFNLSQCKCDICIALSDSVNIYSRFAGRLQQFW